MATISQENARQIRDPMRVFFDMEASSSATITNYNVGTHKLYDATLGNVQWDMRVLADLEGEGFLLDGTAEWYEDKTPSSDNGKLGARGVVDENLSIGITLNQVTPAVIVETEGVSEIRVGSSVYEVSGVDTIPAPSRNFTMVFVPDEEHGRAAVKYIYPGAKFEIRNENLIRAELNLRCNLDPFATTLEGSDIEIQAYYQNDIGDMLRYIGDDWPILYQAGYSGEKSFVRKFYLTDATWSNHVLTIRGVDAVQKLDVTIKEGSLDMTNLDSLRAPDDFLPDWIAQVIRRYVPNAEQAINFSNMGFSPKVIRKEGTIREVLQRFMSLTLSLPYDLRFSYVDAGKPIFRSGDSWTRKWEINEEDLGEITRTLIRNVGMIETGSSSKYDEVMVMANAWTRAENLEVEAGTIFEVDYNGGYADSVAVYDGELASSPKVEMISFTPSGATFKAARRSSRIDPLFFSITPTSGADKLFNPNGLPGDRVTYEPFIVGSLIYRGRGVNMLSPNNLFSVNRDTIEFTYKGDPRWQPFDLLKIRRTDGTTYLKTRISSINLVHEGGGTIARVVAKLMSDEELEGVNW